MIVVWLAEIRLDVDIAAANTNTPVQLLVEKIYSFCLERRDTHACVRGKEQNWSTL